MEIHRQDFEKSLPQIREAILSADFISIDTELTGFFFFLYSHSFTASLLNIPFFLCRSYFARHSNASNRQSLPAL
jgi:hypothetical protein